MSTIRLAAAPIAWTNDDMPELGGATPYEQILSETALAGFEGTEVGSKYPHDPEVLLPALRLRGLRVASAWFSSYLTTRPFDETAAEFVVFRDYLHALGTKVINVAEQGHSIQGMIDVPVFDEKPSFTDQEWDRLTTGLERFADLAAETGQKVVYHHHMGTGVQTTAEIDRLMENTDPDKVYLLLDVGHLCFSGEDPISIVEKYRDRIRHVHLKDIRPEVLARVKDDRLSFLQAVLAGVFTVPGDGATDFEPILRPLIQSDFDGWFVVEAEQDPAKANPLQYALAARGYLREHIGL